MVAVNDTYWAILITMNRSSGFMKRVPQEALLLSIQTKDELFETFDDIFSSDNYHKVLMSFEEGDTFSDVSDKLDIGDGTVSRAMEELEEYGLITIEEGERQHSMLVLTHPLIQYYYWEEFIDE